MPFRLGMPMRKFNIFVFDQNKFDSGDDSDWHFYFTWYANTPEEIYLRFNASVSGGLSEGLKLVEINEVLWESIL